jgi:Lrp/AsnC family leucine-responsive transcriptional regulator
LDELDVRILSVLQEQGRITNAELAARVRLSPSPCLRRVRRLENERLITGYRAILDRPKVGLGMTCSLN